MLCYFEVLPPIFDREICSHKETYTLFFGVVIHLHLRSMKRAQKNERAAYRAVKNRLSLQRPLPVMALEEFKLVNGALRNFSFASRCIYEKDLITRVEEAPKLIHSYVRGEKKRRSAIGPIKLRSGEIIRDSKEMSNVFEDALASVFLKEITDQPIIVQSVGHVINDSYFSGNGEAGSDVIEYSD